jgi:hypothetical protein
VPKKLFIPLTLFYPLATLLQLPCMIYHFDKIALIEWLTSCFQVVLVLGVLYRLRCAGRFSWPLVPLSYLAGPAFRWQNLVAFGLLNILGLLPLAAVYLFFCATLAVSHFTGGFMSLHPGGLTVQARKYVRDDGKTIRLFPMSHVAEADFYQTISKTFTTNSIILMEGVTDEDNLLTNKISYARMAKTLGLAEQHKEFQPKHGKIVRADIDVNQFTPHTIALLNWIMLLHGQGVNAATAPKLLRDTPTLDQAELFADLLGKRNRHLLDEIQSHLSQTDDLVIPWGVAHMPGISQEIQKFNFHLQQSNDYTVIRFFHSPKPAAAHKP